MSVEKKRTTASLMLKATLATIILILAGTGVTITRGGTATSELPNFEVALLVNKNGKVIPVAKDGSRIKPCGRVGRNKSRCKALNQKSRVKTVKSISFLKYRINPNCYLLMVGGYQYEHCS